MQSQQLSSFFGVDALPDDAGGAMFVGCVVAGSVIMANGGVPARGALMRDTASVIIAVSFIGLVLASGLVRILSRPTYLATDMEDASATLKGYSDRPYKCCAL